MKKALRYMLRISVWIIGLLAIFWIIAWSYITINKQSIIEKITSELNDKINARVQISDLDPGFFHTFPFLSLKLSKVTIRDTLWEKHRHEFLSAEKFFVRINPLSLFAKKPHISKLIIENGSIHLFTDTTGYTNSYILKAKNQARKGGMEPPFDAVELKNVKLSFINPEKSKYFDIEIRKMTCKVETVDTGTVVDIKTTMFIHGLAFNTDKGSFLKEKPLEGKFSITLGNQKIQFEDILLKIDDHPFRLTGTFNLDKTDPSFKLLVKTEEANYKRTIKLLTDSIQKKLDRYDISSPLNVSATLEGKTQYRNIPSILVEANAVSADILSPAGKFTNCSFSGSFTNGSNPSLRRTDENSAIRLISFSGEWEGIPINAPTISIDDLVNPVISCDIKTSFDVEELDELGGSSTFSFTKGKANVDLRYKGPLKDSDSLKTIITGTINFKDASMNYVPRQLRLTDCEGTIKFDSSDVYIKQVKAKTKNSDLLINGSVKNFLTILDKTPQNLLMDLKINSGNLDLSDFTQNLGKRNKPVSKATREAKFLKTAAKIDRFIDQSAMKLEINAKKIQYKKFVSTNVNAAVLVNNDGWVIEKVLLNNAGGTLMVSGQIKNDGVNNPFSIKGQMNNIDISKVFYAFNNFSIEGITDKNINGELTADFELSASISDKAYVVPYSTRGFINMSLKNGALINFGPMEKISVSLLKNRDFSDVRFAELKDRIDIHGSEIKVNQMEIQSTVLSMYVQGIYDMSKGTDMSILVPLSNLKKRGPDFELVNKGVDSKKGISVHLRAKTGEDGKIKVTWDPFKKARKNIVN